MTAVVFEGDSHPFALQPLHLDKAVGAVFEIAEEVLRHALDIAVNRHGTERRIVLGVIFREGSILAVNVLFGQKFQQ